MMNLPKNFRSSLQMISDFTRRPWFFYLALLIIMFLPYVGQFSRLGYIKDDMQVVFLARLGHPLDFWNYFISDRPLSIWTYLVTVPWMGVTPPPWHLFTLLMRWLSVVGFTLGFEGLWPGRITQVRWMGLLLAFYPGFHEQTQALAFSQHFIAYALFTLSLAGMIGSLRRPAWAKLLTPLAVLASLGNAATMEYFIGLELLRPVILWMMLHKKGQPLQQSAGEVLKKWSPYLLVLVGFAVWRFYFYPQLTPEPERNNPLLFLTSIGTVLSTLKELIRMALQDFLQVSLLAWPDTLEPAFSQSNNLYILFTWAAGLLAAFAMLWLLTRAEEKDLPGTQDPGQFTRQGMLVGLLAIYAGGLPVWLIGRQVIEGGNSNRFALAPMFGVVILVVCVIDWLAGRSGRGSLVLAVLLGLSIATQFLDVNKASQNWQAQRQFMWQLYWRAPALKPGTLVLGRENLAVNNFGLNILYTPRLNPTQASYWYSETYPVDARPGQAIVKQLRNISFQSSNSAILAVVYRNDFGCLKVLSPEMKSNPWLTGFEPAYAAFSNPGQIEIAPTQPGIPPAEIFGHEPPHDWCYYYEKAALASQDQNWNRIASLAQQAAQAGLGAQYGTELVPFIEGYAHLDQWQQAYQYTRDAMHMDGNRSYSYLCAFWKKLNKELPPSDEKENALANLSRPLICSFH
jgi:hypothetical protein